MFSYIPKGGNPSYWMYALNLKKQTADPAIATGSAAIFICFDVLWPFAFYGYFACLSVFWPVYIPVFRR